MHALSGGWMKRIACFFFFLPFLAFGQYETPNHPELKWLTLETGHFFVHYHAGTERTARLTAKIAEDLFLPVTSLYEYRPKGKIHFIVRDHDDNSNGAAYYYDEKIEIWAPPMDFEFRGTHDWLRNVIAHEFSHMISMGAARRMPRAVPAVYLQWIDYEKEKRPDVIHGYPRTLVSVPLAGTVIPVWLAEGMAQFQRAGLSYDGWDSHRDMLLRTAVFEGGLLGINGMSRFGKNSLGNERVYNQGYGLTLYIYNRFGEEALNALVREMKKPWNMGFTCAAQKALGRSEKELYEEWVSWLREGYSSSFADTADLLEGHVLESEGCGNFYPVFSPDGRNIAYISNRGSGYLSQLSLRLYDTGRKKSAVLRSGVTSSASWAPDGKRIVYAKKTAWTGWGSRYFDLYILDLGTRRETRITHARRTRQPDFSPDGRQIACIVEHDGTSNLAIVGDDGRNMRTVTHFQDGEQLFGPKWTGETGRIVFAISARHGRDIASIDTAGGELTYLVRTSADERDPMPDRDGKGVYYSSDASGIFNLYHMDLASGRSVPVSTVVGGAFMPCPGPGGKLVYAQFRSGGYTIALMDSVREKDPSDAGYVSPYEPVRRALAEHPWEITGYDDTEIPEHEAKPYKPLYTGAALMPRIMMDYPDKLKFGAYFYTNDVLDKLSLLGGAAVNTQADADLFLMFQYRRLFPTLFLEGYYQRRHTEEQDAAYAFDLAEIDVGADWNLGQGCLLRSSYVYSRYEATMSFDEQGQKIKFPYTYHIGSELQLKMSYRSVPPSLSSSIAPDKGRILTFEAKESWMQFLDGFEIHSDYGTIVELYKKYRYEQFLLQYQEYFPLPFHTHSLSILIKAGLIDRVVDSFYHFFAGGLDGLKGYPYYSIEGRKMAQLRLAYQLPLSTNLNFSLLSTQFEKLALIVYGDVGDAWVDDGISKDWKTDAGVQLRLSLLSFYAYPTSIFFDACYGLNRFEHKGQQYGGEWRTYFGILFDFPD